jgi:FAD/FMN-containing dehydrogenase
MAMICYNGPLADGERVIQPLRDLGRPLLDAVSPISYTAIQTFFDAGAPAGMRNYWRSHFLTELSDAGIDTLVDIHRSSPSPQCTVLLENLGGAVNRVGRAETAFNFRDSDYNLTVFARWQDPARTDEHIAWVRNGSDAMKSYGSGVYVNYLGAGEQADRVRAAYGEEKYARLVDLKNRYDPTNRFRFNQNIKPTA